MTIDRRSGCRSSIARAIRHRVARVIAMLLATLVALNAVPAQAAVTITFWSHDFGSSFPHAFVTLRGMPDAGGAPVDTAYGFTATTLSPAILFGNIAGMIETPNQAYIDDSDAQFSLELTDEQYRAELELVDTWSRKPGSRYNLNKRNCVHFTAEAARIAGLAGLDQPQLMKKPRSYLAAVAAANAGRIAIVGLKGSAYAATLPPLPAGTPVPPAPAIAPVPAAQPAGTISITSSVDAKAG